MSEPSTPEQPTLPARKRPWLKICKWLAVTLVIFLVLAELVARIGFGLGNPPLSMFDPDMEYRFQPNKTYHRFGRLIHYNEYSQRAEDFPEHKSSPDELRVMVIGDSVVNGGAQTDQSQLVTAILEKRLSEALHRKVIVGNISAGSWGPPNELAYVKKFGLFDADVVVLVFNDLDAFDAMTFEPIVGKAVEFPDHAPLLALQEVFERYLPMFLARFRSPPPPATAPVQDEQAALNVCMDAIRQLVQTCRAHGAKVFIAQHRELPERAAPSSVPQLIEGDRQIAQVAHEMGLEPIHWSDEFHAAMKNGQDPYRPGDFVHPSVLGDQIMADVLFPIIRDALLNPTTQPATQPMTTPMKQPASALH